MLGLEVGHCMRDWFPSDSHDSGASWIRFGVVARFGSAFGGAVFSAEDRWLQSLERNPQEFDHRRRELRGPEALTFIGGLGWRIGGLHDRLLGEADLQLTGR